MADYVELHANSAFSFLRGGSDPKDLARAAAHCELPTVALSDRDGVYGAPRFYKAAKEAGIRPIVGAELTLKEGGVLPLLVSTQKGYQNLCRLITRGQLRSEKGCSSFSLAELKEFSQGLIALTGHTEEGLLSSKDPSLWREKLRSLQESFPEKDHLYVELNQHKRRGDRRRVRYLSELAETESLPILASNAVCYATEKHRVVSDVFTCLRNHTHLDKAGKLLSQNKERHFKTANEIGELFRDYPEALLNTCRLADRLDFTLENLGYEFPRYKVPMGETMDSFLRKVTFFGAGNRYGSITPKIRKQLNHELGIIEKLGFSGYFLIVWDIVNFCLESGVMVQGRGSAANSAVCYCLGITAVDPIESKLLFERFLSEGHASWPDVDLDLPSGDRRESVIQEVYQRYGKHGSAMTANVITYRGRSAIREIGKVLNFPTALIDRFSNLNAYGGGSSKDLKEKLEEAGIPKNHPRTSALVGLYNLIYGLPRHLGQHSGGMIICENALDQVVPLENASMPGRVVSQWDKDDCEDLGIVKVDLLGLGMMAVMQDALEMTRERGHPVDLAHIPKDDKKTFECMQKADTIGVFQIESRAQQATLPRMRPETFYDVAIEVAIIRPGPIQGDLVHPYLARRQGRAPIDYIDDRLKSVLERTLGVPLYQEQMLQIAMIMADFSGSEADELRRALNFNRDPERLERVQKKMQVAMERKNIEQEKIKAIMKATGSFALYGFPESHAISFGLLAYASTYLKVHYTAEFYCGLLNNQPMGFYSPATLIQDAKRRGMKFKAPCVRRSEFHCTIQDDRTIQLGLYWVKGIASRKIEQLLKEREKAPFTNLNNLRDRTRFDADELRKLSLSGALNEFSGDRRSALWEVAEIREDNLLANANPTRNESTPLEAMTYLERIQADYESVGLTVGKHPMRLIRSKLPELWRAKDLAKGRNGQRLEVAGAVICRQRPGTAKGFVFVSLEDETGIINMVLTAEFFEENRLVVKQEPFLRFKGRLQNVDKVVHVRAETVSRLYVDGLPESSSHDFH